MIIDCHQHFWKYNARRDSWINDSMKALQKDFLPADIEPVLKKNNIKAGIAIQADQSEEETKFLLKLADEYDFIKGVIGWVDLRESHIETKLAHFSENKKFKGVRHILQNEKNDFVLGKAFQNGISLLNSFNLVYEILIYPAQLKNTIKLVNNFSDQIFILDHMAKPKIKEQEIDSWRKDIVNLSKAENVYCKISGMVTEASWKNWIPNDFKPYLDVVFKSFGANRVLFGSDWPVCTLSVKYEEVLGIITDYIRDFSKDDKEKVWMKNALKIYNLDN